MCGVRTQLCLCFNVRSNPVKSPIDGEAMQDCCKDNATHVHHNSAICKFPLRQNYQKFCFKTNFTQEHRTNCKGHWLNGSINCLTWLGSSNTVYKVLNEIFHFHYQINKTGLPSEALSISKLHRIKECLKKNVKLKGKKY